MNNPRMKNLEDFKHDYPQVLFTEKRDAPDLHSFEYCLTLDDILDEMNSVSYFSKNMDSEEATEYLSKIIVYGYVQGLKDALNNIAPENNSSNFAENSYVDRDALTYQMCLAESIGDCLTGQNSDEATRVKNACKCKYYNQLILFNERTMKLVLVEDVDLNEHDFENACVEVDKIFSSVFCEFIADENTNATDEFGFESTKQDQIVS